PRIIQHPKSVNIIYGKTLTLQCNGTSSPIANVTWLKDGNPLTSYDDIKLIENFYVYSRLTISNITTQDEGLYQCRYDNIIGSITSEVATVAIYDHPRIIQHPKNVNIIYGKTLTLQCNGTSSPIAKVTWLKDGNPLISYDDLKLIESFYVYSRLTISNITTQDEGLYQCRYDNIIGSITSEVATVTIYDSPRIVQYPTNTFVYEGNLTMLECNGTSSPISTVTWLKDGIALQNYKNITIIEKFYTYSRLVIPEVSNNDIGNYQCQYNNFLGSATSNKTFIDLIGKLIWFENVLKRYIAIDVTDTP
ncbi:uncharacterized protein TRIADDRAFT_34144, partial [Trichoplax adhaerens]